MTENLKVSKYNDGSRIPNLINQKKWDEDIFGAWCYYDNNPNNNKSLGKLYNWYSINPTLNGNKNICPSGWHVPTTTEWWKLFEYLGGDYIAGSKLKADRQKNESLNNSKNNNIGFNGLYAGCREKIIGFDNYNSKGKAGRFWSSTQHNDFTDIAMAIAIKPDSEYALEQTLDFKSGNSVRCIQNDRFYYNFLIDKENKNIMKTDGVKIEIDYDDQFNFGKKERVFILNEIIEKQSKNTIENNQNITWDNNFNENTVEKIESFVDEEPEFPFGSMNAFYEWITRNLEFPEGSDGAEIKARIVLSKNGEINDFRFVNSSYPELERVIKRRLLQSPKWKPARLNGKPVNYYFVIPFRFIKY